mgnify:CR=1 FL=1
MSKALKFFDVIFASCWGFIVGITLGVLMASFNECEALHEIKVTPDKLREIATEMERVSKVDTFQAGQVIRYKLGHLFALVYKPERSTAKEENHDQDEHLL